MAILRGYFNCNWRKAKWLALTLD